MKNRNNKFLIVFIVVLIILLFSIIIGIINYKTNTVFVSDFNKLYAELLAEHKYQYEADEFLRSTAPKNYSEFFTGNVSVKVSNNKTVEFVGTKGTKEKLNMDAMWYTYLLYIPEIDSHLIRQDWYEGNQYILVNNETGSVQNIWSIPHISPQKDRITVTNKDMLAQFTVNGIQIFEIVSGNYVKQFEQRLEKWGIDNPRWLNNDAFVADKYVHIRGDYGEKLAGKVTIKRVVDGWNIED